MSLDNALSKSSLPARQLASVTGSIISNMLVLGNVCKLMTTSLHRALDRREGWESRVDLDPCGRKDLEFWKSASAVGCAAFIAINDTPVSHKTGILCR